MKSIIVGGMPQAGSTLCFNLIREMIEANGMGVKVSLGARQPQYSKKGETTNVVDYELVKNHTKLNRNFTHKINVRRDIRDSVASNKRKDPKFLNGDVIQIANRNINWYNQYASICNYEFVYEDYKADSRSVMKEITNLFGFVLSDEQIDEVINKTEGLKDENLSQGHKWGHPMWNKTLMSKAHITSNKGKIGGYKDTLTSEEINRLEVKYGDWLRVKGYMRDEVNVKDYIRGWFIGNFEPSILKTDDFEVGIKEYVIGTVEPEHFHKEAVEYTIVLDGTITMNGNEYNKHDICIIDKGETNTFEAITDARVLVVKTPCVSGDKYLSE